MLKTRVKAKGKSQNKTNYENLINVSEKMKMTQRRGKTEIESRAKMFIQEKQRLEAHQGLYQNSVSLKAKYVHLNHHVKVSNKYSNEKGEHMKNLMEKSTKLTLDAESEKELGHTYLKSFEKKLEADKTFKKNLMDANKRTIQEVNELKVKQKKKSKEIEEIKDKNEKMGEQITSFETENANLRKKNDDIKNEIEKSKKEEESLLSEGNMLREEYRKVDMKIREDDNRINQLSIKIDEDNNEKRKLEEKKSRLDKLVEKVEWIPNIPGIVENPNFSKQMQEICSSLFFRLETDVNISCGELKNALEEIIEKSISYSQIKADIEFCEKQCKMLDNSIAKKEELIEKEKKRVEEEKTISSNNTKKLNDLVEGEGNSEKDVEQLIADVQKLENENEKLKQQNSEVQMEFARVESHTKTQISEKEKNLKEMEQVLKKPDNKSIDEELKKATSRFNDLKTEYNKQVKINSELRNKKEVIESQVRSSKEKKNKEVNEKLEKIQKELEEMCEKTKVGEEKLKDKENEMKKNMIKIETNGSVALPDGLREDYNSWLEKKMDQINNAKKEIREKVERMIKEKNDLSGETIPISSSKKKKKTTKQKEPPVKRRSQPSTKVTSKKKTMEALLNDVKVTLDSESEDDFDLFDEELDFFS